MKNIITIPDGAGTYISRALKSPNRKRLLLRAWCKAYANPYLLFLPFLFFFIAYILIKNNNAFESDEARYFIFAQHLLEGYYSDPAPDINLWNGQKRK